MQYMNYAMQYMNYAYALQCNNYIMVITGSEPVSLSGAGGLHCFAFAAAHCNLL